MKCKIDAVLFDLDGTLVETNIDFPFMKQQITSIAVDAGINLNELTNLDILQIVERSKCLIESTSGIKEALTLESKMLKILEDIEVKHAQNTQKIPFANEIINLLKNNNIKTGIVTRNCKAASKLSLDITGIDIDVLVSREDCKNHKPHPDQVLLALKMLNAKAHNSIMIGDYLYDIMGGKAAGMKTIGFLRENRPENFFDELSPDLVVKSLKEAMDAIINCDC